jgi:tetratricopeptide (TPR) repeat protein
MTAAFASEQQLLHNALQTESFRFVLASHNHPSAYKEVRQGLQARFGQTRKIQEFSFSQKDYTDIRDAVLGLGSGILLLHDLEYLFRDENSELCTYFNQRRDFFAKYPIAFICFIEPSTHTKVLQKIPDWWSLRSLELEFMVTMEAPDILEMQWSMGDSSPYANWTPKQREEERARLQRLVENTDEENVGLLGQLYADLGSLFYFSNNYKQSIEFFNKSIPLLNESKKLGDVFNDISLTYSAQGDYEMALGYLEKSLAIQKEIGNRQSEGIALGNIGQIYEAFGDYKKALDAFEKALAILLEIGDRQSEGAILNNIGQILYLEGNHQTALEYFNTSLTLKQEIGDYNGESVTLSNIGQIYHTNGDYDTALIFFQRSLEISQKIGDRRGENTTLNNISQVYDAKGNYETSLAYLQESYTIAHEIGDRNGIAIVLTNMGATLFEHNQYEEAIPLLLSAHQIFEKNGSLKASIPMNHLSNIKERIGEHRYQEIIAKIEPNPQ